MVRKLSTSDANLEDLTVTGSKRSECAACWRENSTTSDYSAGWVLVGTLFPY
jgi:hypothetical protein